MENLSTLKLRETILVEPERIGSLVGEFGPQGAERMLCAAVAEMQHQVRKIEVAAGQADARSMTHAAAIIAPLARQIGMPTLARVAADVASCAHARNTPAMAATLARLQRLACALLPYWDESAAPAE